MYCLGMSSGHPLDPPHMPLDTTVFGCARGRQPICRNIYLGWLRPQLSHRCGASPLQLLHKPVLGGCETG